MIQNGPKLPQMAQKWRPDLRTFTAIFFTEKAVPQTFLLLECMLMTLEIKCISSWWHDIMVFCVMLTGSPPDFGKQVGWGTWLELWSCICICICIWCLVCIRWTVVLQHACPSPNADESPAKTGPGNPWAIFGQQLGNHLRPHIEFGQWPKEKFFFWEVFP